MCYVEDRRELFGKVSFFDPNSDSFSSKMYCVLVREYIQYISETYSADC